MTKEDDDPRLEDETVNVVTVPTELFDLIWNGKVDFLITETDLGLEVGDQINIKDASNHETGFYFTRGIMTAVEQIVRGDIFGLDSERCVIGLKSRRRNRVWI